MLIIRPAIRFTSRASNTKEAVTNDNSISINNISKANLVSVSVDNRYYYLAKKTGDTHYELLYVNPYHSIHHCQAVYTTGLDQQFSADLKIGYIDTVESSSDALYIKITISHDLEC